MKFFPIILLLIGCSSPEANHLGNPLAWPVTMATIGIENGAYNFTRNKLKKHITEHFAHIYQDVRMGGGPQLQHSMDIARVPQVKHEALLSELQSNPKLYFGKDIEPLVVAVMVHGN